MPLPDELEDVIARLREEIPEAVISVHCHNDLGLAVANSIAALKAGARQVECTVNGVGERAGNTSLEEIVMALRVRHQRLGLTTGVRSEEITRTSHLLSAITGVWPQPNKAVVGRNAFAHEAGIHQHGVLKNPLTYEIMTPVSVGAGESHLVLGKHSGHHAVESRLRALGLTLSRQEIAQVTVKVKALADRKKFVYDEDLLALVTDAPPRRMRLIRYQSLAGNNLMPTASVEVEVDGERRSSSAVGNGPLDAALKAMDAALGLELELIELSTRAVTGGRTLSPRSSFVSAPESARPRGTPRARIPSRPPSRPISRPPRAWAGPRSRSDGEAEDALREDLGVAPGQARERADASGPLRRSPPRPRGDLAAGLHGASGTGPQGTTAGPDGGDDGPLNADHAPGGRPDRRHGRSGGGAARGPGGELPRLPDHAPRPGQRDARGHPRHRTRASASRNRD